MGRKKKESNYIWEEIVSGMEVKAEQDFHPDEADGVRQIISKDLKEAHPDRVYRTWTHNKKFIVYRYL